MEPIDISWHAPEFEYRPKGAHWYWTTIIVAVLALGLAVWQKNFLFAVFIVTAEILVLVWSGRAPDEVRFRVTNRSITIRERDSHLFVDMEQFSVEEAPEGAEWTTIVLRPRRKFRLPLFVTIPTDLVEDVRSVFQETLPEVPWELSLVDSLERFVQF